MVGAAVWEDILFSIAIIAVAGVSGELTIRFLRRAGERSGAKILSVRLIRQLIRAAWVGLAILGILTVWGVTSDVLTAIVVGLVALVVSLSLQSTLSNMISGTFLLYDGVIRLGDHIEHFALKGEVIRVALRNTWVRSESGVIAVVGNAKLADGPTFNSDLSSRLAAAARSTAQGRPETPPANASALSADPSPQYTTAREPPL